MLSSFKCNMMSNKWTKMLLWTIICLRVHHSFASQRSAGHHSNIWNSSLAIYCSQPGVNLASAGSNDTWKNCYLHSSLPTEPSLRRFPDLKTLSQLCHRLEIDIENKTVPVLPSSLQLNASQAVPILPSLQLAADNLDERLRIILQEVEVLSPTSGYWKQSTFIPHLFNSAMIRIKDHMLVSYRHELRQGFSRLRFRWLKDDLSGIDEEADHYGVNKNTSEKFVLYQYLESQAGDSRMLMLSNGSFLVTYATYLKQWATSFYFIVDLHHDQATGKYTAIASENYILYHDSESGHQKNWIPLELNGSIHFITHYHPLKILKVTGLEIPGSLYHYTPAKLEIAYDEQQQKTQDGNGNSNSNPLYETHVAWHGHIFGQSLRGGTNPVYLPQLDCYIAFFHTATHLQFGPMKYSHVNTYFMGALTFKAVADPPFHSLLSTSALPIVRYQQFYTNAWCNKFVDYAVYPAGLELSSDGKSLLVMMSHNDKDGYLLTLDLQGLLASLTPVLH